MLTSVSCALRYIYIELFSAGNPALDNGPESRGLVSVNEIERIAETDLAVLLMVCDLYDEDNTVHLKQHAVHLSGIMTIMNALSH